MNRARHRREVTLLRRRCALASRWHRLCVGLALLSTPVARAQDLTPYAPLAPAQPPAPLGSAHDPEESPEQASPASPEKYPPAAVPDGGPPLADQKRAVPSYDPNPQCSSGGSAVLWVPRILLSPLYLTTEFVLRRPLEAGASYAETHLWPARLIEFFTWNDRSAGLVPVVLDDWGFRPNIGFYLFWNDAFALGNDVRLLTGFGGPDWMRADFTDRLALTSSQSLELRLYASTRPDHLFWGLGPESPPDPVRFGATDLESRLRYRVLGWRNSRLDAAARLRSVRFDSQPDEYADASLGAAVASGRMDAPAGLPGYDIASASVQTVFDTRPARLLTPARPASDYDPLPGSGVRLALGAEYSGELESATKTDDSAHAWLTYGGSLGGYVDLSGQQRTVGLTLTSQFADPIGSDLPIPFTELPSLGGNDLLRGFQPLRLIDRSAIAAELNYRWPIWAYLDGNLDLGLGNVFGEHLAGVDWERLRLSAVLGFRTVGSLDYPFQLLVGFGTQTLANGAHPEDVRFIFGTTNEF